MASLTAAPGSASVIRGAKAGNKIAANSVSSLRFKPFTKLGKSLAPKQQKNLLLTRVAEPEAPAAAGAAEDQDFDFNYSDAKKNNQYDASDVEAALRYYTEGQGVIADYDKDFVTNLFGTEDASFFDDIDNNEAYEADEYIVAGIPEAAPKKRRRGGRDGAKGEADESDEVEQAKELDKMKELEDQMLVEAALEEEFGSAVDRQDQVQLRADKPGMWDWLTDYSEQAAEVDEELANSKLMTVRRSKAELPSDSEVLSSFGAFNVEQLDQETRDLLELVVGEDITEEEVKTIDVNVDDNVPASEPVAAADMAVLEGLTSKTVEHLAVKDVAMPSVPLLMGEEAEMNKSTVESYVASLQQAAGAKSDMTVDQVKAMFSAEGEAVELEGPEDADNDAETDSILKSTEASVPKFDDVDFNTEADKLLITAEEEADYELKDFRRELQALTAVDEMTEQDMPSAEQLAILDQYLAAAEDYVASEDQRKQDLAAAVARGELSVDALAEELEEVPDMEAELLDDAEEEGDEVAFDDEDDGEQWVERIIELTRVTKVVKGGKIMGFRCVAIVGNQNGLVGVGCQAGREVAVAVKRTLVDAKKNIVRVPLVGAGTIPHKSEAKYHAARCVIVPASDGTGVIAGGAIRSVLELAGVQNVLAKRIGSRSQLNNARATVKALQQLKTLNEVAKYRGIPMDQLLLSSQQ
eukprot:CAMPEP_0202899994 /NCGR_PEP_ID=MMETSP1392-20130828/9370_1 /ASSEMBLY_ACC=CAM_ASM_000868 /TAXON_ID=225041 /ORGANISM="Chlamydomonas chlamydogama, Strain SAG 11-48b" /LENGTH=694 /DNA_ID=CAMNT_0049586301 /DNA_START=96 /DNA_END=2180 /DNA_ORIENTATION=-